MAKNVDNATFFKLDTILQLLKLLLLYKELSFRGTVFFSIVRLTAEMRIETKIQRSSCNITVNVMLSLLSGRVGFEGSGNITYIQNLCFK